MHRGTICSTVLVACCIWLANGPAPAQTEPDRVELIMSKLPPQNSANYKIIKKLAGKATSQFLTLTNTEMWSIPKGNVNAVKKAAAQHGASVKQLGADWNHVFRPAPPNMTITDKQNAILERVMADKATMGVSVVAMSAPPMVEYALTKDADAPAGSKDAAKIKIKLSGKTVIVITRTSVKIERNVCIWRGVVDGTGAPAMLMWWPGGRMAGIIRHQGRIYSIRHMGGAVHAIIEISKDRMPPEHAPLRQRAPDVPFLRDDPRVQGRCEQASGLRPGRQTVAA